MPRSISRSPSPVVARTPTTAPAARARATTRTTGYSGTSSYADGAASRTRLRTSSRAGRSSGSTTTRAPVGSTRGTLRRGQSSESVRALQQRLQAAGFNVGTPDGIFGPATERAVKEFQRARGLRPDGIAGRRTFQALDSFGAPTPRARRAASAETPRAAPRTTTPSAGARTGGSNGSARLNGQPRGPGRTNGTITVNGRTYRFNSGSSRHFSIPQGTYRVRAHLNSRSDAGYALNGVGYSYVLEDPRRPGSDRFYDARAGRDRTALRIHPDGGSPGTAGCIGIVGDAATLRQFREDLNAELRRNGGSYSLTVR